MMLSKETIAALVDLIENKLMMMHIGDRDDLREMVTLKSALHELRGLDSAEAGVLKNFGEIPRRGRRRKVSDMIEERELSTRE
jgi:Mg2+ and Co2+ transporter CorA